MRESATRLHGNSSETTPDEFVQKCLALGRAGDLDGFGEMMVEMLVALCAGEMGRADAEAMRRDFETIVRRHMARMPTKRQAVAAVLSGATDQALAAALASFETFLADMFAEIDELFTWPRRTPLVPGSVN
jgi:hypothetical protein